MPEVIRDAVMKMLKKQPTEGMESRRAGRGRESEGLSAREAICLRK